MPKPTLLPFTMGMSRYDHVEAVLSGEIEISGTRPVFLSMPIPEIFRRFVNDLEWEVSELSAAQYVSRRSAGDDRLVALPIFPARLFRHGAIVVRRDRIARPEDLIGARCGTPEWSLTAGVWARGLLADLYGVRPEDIRWFRGGMDRPGRPESVNPPSLSKDVSLTSVTDRGLEEMLFTGELDAIIAPKFSSAISRAISAGDEVIGPLFNDSQAASADYLEKTGIFPIMHVVALKRSFHEEHPWLASNIYRAFELARRRYFARILDESSSRVPLPMVGMYLDGLKQRFGSDIWPYGLEPNRRVFETLIRYEREQGMLVNDITADDLFVEVESFVDGQ